MNMVKAHRNFLKVIGVLYFAGFILHLLDVLNLRMNLSEMDFYWKIWIWFLLIFDFLTSFLIFKNKLLGEILFVAVAFSQLTAYSFFKDRFGDQSPLIYFHLISLFSYIAIKVLKSNFNNQAFTSIDTEELFNLEKQLHTFEVRSNKDRLSKLLSDDFFEFGSSGNVWTHEDILNRLPTEDGQTKIESYNYKAMQLSDSTVLITYISKRVLGENIQTEYLRSSIWQFVNNKWKIKFHQGTVKAEK